MSTSCPAWRSSRSWCRNRSRAIYGHCLRLHLGLNPIPRPPNRRRASSPMPSRTRPERRARRVQSTTPSPPEKMIPPPDPRAALGLLSQPIMSSERLQKIIAAAGIASRRKAEQLITGGLVSVNGWVVTELGSKADSETDHIRVNGKLLHGAERHVYLLLNKPKGYVTTLRDPEGRPTVMDLLHGVSARVYPVGRLDYASEGLLLLTNDGEFANYLMKAASHVTKTYMVKVAGQPTAEGLTRLRAGLSISS